MLPKVASHILHTSTRAAAAVHSPAPLTAAPPAAIYSCLLVVLITTSVVASTGMFVVLNAVSPPLPPPSALPADLQKMCGSVTGVYVCMIPLLMRETRAAVVLTRIAKRLRKKTGDVRYRARVEDERASLRTLVWISCTRPLYLMITEPVVASFSVRHDGPGLYTAC